jgi:hypothetical protein
VETLSQRLGGKGSAADCTSAGNGALHHGGHGGGGGNGSDVQQPQEDQAAPPVDSPFELRALEVALDMVNAGCMSLGYRCSAVSTAVSHAGFQQLQSQLFCGAHVKSCSYYGACESTYRNRQQTLLAAVQGPAHPALDALTRRVTTTTLERVRRVKTRLVRLKTRVETVSAARDCTGAAAPIVVCVRLNLQVSPVRRCWVCSDCMQQSCCPCGVWRRSE